jgi:hypothetical protein
MRRISPTVGRSSRQYRELHGCPQQMPAALSGNA